MRFPGRGGDTPNKNQVADYLQSYARRFKLPVQNGVRVDAVTKEGDRFVVTASDLRIECENVVVAMANYQKPRIPAFARDLDPGIVQLHAHEYRNPSQLQNGGVLIVGLGNSGADIGLEVARTHQTWLSGKESGHIPFRIDTFLSRHLLSRIVTFIGHRILAVNTPIGRKVRPNMLTHAAPLVRVKLQNLVEAGIDRVPRVVGVRDGRPVLADGRNLDVKNVVWCTGYEPGFSWIQLPVFAKDGQPIHERGIVTQLPGMYFVGLHFLFAMSSATLIGVGRDASRVVKAIRQRIRMSKPQKVEELRQAPLIVGSK
jgi:putative flavoprotein involved in K+ transport